jgi:DNA-binding transcriptional ArsR family regulator
VCHSFVNELYDIILTDQFGILEQELAHYTRAIGHPARVAVLLAIAKKGNLVEGDVIDVPPLSKATVIQHLRELKRAGLIDGRIFGVKSKYWIDKDNFEKFKKDFSSFSSQINIDVAP